MFKFIVALLILLIAFFVGIIVYESYQSKAVELSKASKDSVSDDEPADQERAEKKYEYLPKFLKVKRLETVKLFKDMNADISYYGKVCRNPNAYHHLVGDERIYNKDEVTLIYQFHCYHFFKYHGSMDDMKGDFLGSFLIEYHGLTQSEVDNLAIIADGYANP